MASFGCLGGVDVSLVETMISMSIWMSVFVSVRKMALFIVEARVFSCFVFNGEFDPGSGRTLAACLTHASRAERPFGVLERRTGE